VERFLHDSRNRVKDITGHIGYWLDGGSVNLPYARGMGRMAPVIKIGRIVLNSRPIGARAHPCDRSPRACRLREHRSLGELVLKTCEGGVYPESALKSCRIRIRVIGRLEA